MSDVITYDLQPDEAIRLARTEYVFFGTPLEVIQEKFQIPKEILGELAFLGEENWRTLRAKVEEDELDGLINSNVYVIEKGLHAAMAKAQEFLGSDAATVEDWSDVEKLMKTIAVLTKAAEASKNMQEHRLPQKVNKQIKKGELPLYLTEGELADDEESAKFEDEYSKPSRNKKARVEKETMLEDSLDNLI